MARHLSEIVLENIQTRLKGRSAYWLSKESGVSQASLSRLLNGQEKNPSLETIARLSMALECEPWEMVMALEEQEKRDAFVARVESLRDLTGDRVTYFNQVMDLRRENETLKETNALQAEAIRGLQAAGKLHQREAEELESLRRENAVMRARGDQFKASVKRRLESEEKLSDELAAVKKEYARLGGENEALKEKVQKLSDSATDPDIEDIVKALRATGPGKRTLVRDLLGLPAKKGAKASSRSK